MHLETKRLKDLSKTEKDKFFIRIGIAKNRLENIRKLPAKIKLIEAAKLALEIDPTANEDFIEWIAGYKWRGVAHNYFDNFDALLSLAKKELPEIRNKFEIKTSNDKIDILKLLPKKINNCNLYFDINDDFIYIWQKDISRVRKIRLKRIVDKKIFLIGIALYAGEGTKSLKRSGIEIVNSNFSIMRTFVKFLSELGIKKDELKARVHVHSGKDIEEAIDLWIENIGLKRKQFNKPLIKKTNYYSKEKSFTLDLRFYNSMMQKILLFWVTNFEETINKI